MNYLTLTMTTCQPSIVNKFSLKGMLWHPVCITLSHCPNNRSSSTSHTLSTKLYMMWHLSATLKHRKTRKTKTGICGLLMDQCSHLYWQKWRCTKELTIFQAWMQWLERIYLLKTCLQCKSTFHTILSSFQRLGYYQLISSLSKNSLMRGKLRLLSLSLRIVARVRVSSSLETLIQLIHWNTT